MSGLIGDASNIIVGSNPSYVYTDFTDDYPQFNSTIIPQILVEKYISLAHSCIKEARWHDIWNIAMGWFVAHFCSLYVQGTADANSAAGAVIEAGKAKGLDVSQSVGGVSVTTDYNAIGQDLDGWAAWKLTIYGQQLATMGKLVGMGGMYVY
jgi:hypothetical protein